MAVLEKPFADMEALFVSEAQMDEIRAIVARQFEEFGIEYNPDMAPEQLWAMMRAEGIRAEDNEFSRGIIAAREE